MLQKLYLTFRKGLIFKMPIHPFEAVYDKNSKILLLGSFPSVKSRENGFFYGHPQNRFWRVLAALFDTAVPQSIEEKRALLLSNGIALWDCLASCEITGSSDATIKNVTVNDLTPIFENCSIGAVFTNGAAADKIYCKYQQPLTQMIATRLPSTSPANAAFSFERLLVEWSALPRTLGVKKFTQF